ncbi:MAG TPA: DUF2461 family protein [Verrucomicrobiae bacterium]|jgi:uncharacterized protein (TIGR02453 family)|nr:DUF2461 family protein [Verrucomicrobiae bacterium]
MGKAETIFTRATFQFFRDLARNNKKVWMDANRERYQESVVKPFRRLLEEVSPSVLQLDSRFDTTGRAGANFSRINRDIRFAKDKTPYRAQMYLKFSAPFPGEGETGQLYTGISADAVTAGFRIYCGSKRKESALGLIADARLMAEPKWIAVQKKRLGKRYESYWYSLEKKEWKQQRGWPVGPEDWKKLQAWVVRRKLRSADATKAAFPSEIARIFRDLYPLLRFTSLDD